MCRLWQNRPIFGAGEVSPAPWIVTVECEVAERAIGLEVKARRRQNSLTIRRRRNVEIEFEGRSGAMHSTVTVH